MSHPEIEHQQYRREQVGVLTLKGIVDTFQSLIRFIRPLFDLLVRFYLAKIFFVSAVVKLSDWNHALYLSQHEYPVSWMNPILAAYTGVTIELVGSVLLLLGLMTRMAAFALLILTIVIQIYYQELNAQTLWILLLGWYVIFGAGKLSMDHAVRGVKDSAILLSKPIYIVYQELTRYVGPYYQLSARFWIACIAITAGWLMLKSTGDVYPYPALGYQFTGSLLSLVKIHGVELLLIGSGVLIGIGAFTRIICGVSVVALLYFMINDAHFTTNQWEEAIGWVFLLGLFLMWGPGAVSIDHWVKKNIRA